MEQREQSAEPRNTQPQKESMEQMEQNAEPRNTQPQKESMEQREQSAEPRNTAAKTQRAKSSRNATHGPSSAAFHGVIEHSTPPLFSSAFVGGLCCGSAAMLGAQRPANGPGASSA